MNIDRFSYTWAEEKEDYVLVDTEQGYDIVNKRTQMALLISDDALEEVVIAKMLGEGCKVHLDVNDA